jgi:hypothetical protein
VFRAASERCLGSRQIHAAVELLHTIGFYPTEQDPATWQLHTLR